MFSLESPHRGNSNKYTQDIIFNIKYLKIPEICLRYRKSIVVVKVLKIHHPKFSKFCSYGIFFPRGLKNKFKIAMVNEPSVFESLKFQNQVMSTVTSRFQTDMEEISHLHEITFGNYDIVDNNYTIGMISAY